MAYQTGTVANLNDVLRTLRIFLEAQGWTTHVNYREPIFLNRTIDHRTSPFPYDVLHWRWGQRLAMSKGTKFFAAQDFYLTGDSSYGTNVGFANGPGIAIVAGTARANIVEPDDEAYRGGAHPAWYRHYTLAGDGVTPIYGQDSAGPISIPTFFQDVAQASTIMIMPLPMVTSQENGTWTSADEFWVNGYPNNDTELYAPFGPAGGAASPAKYWLMSDPADDSWTMVMVHDTISQTIRTPYMGMGTLKKAGNWVGTGDYLCASHNRLNAFTGTDVSTYPLIGHEINRFGPPASVVDDGGETFSVFLPAVDSTGAGWRSVGGGARRILSTVEMEPISVAPLGQKTGFGYNSLRTLRSSMVDAAPGLPIFLTVMRDSGLQSMIGSVPNIFQAKTFGFSYGTETLAPNGDTYVVFDGFMIKKVP